MASAHDFTFTTIDNKPLLKQQLCFPLHFGFESTGVVLTEGLWIGRHAAEGDLGALEDERPASRGDGVLPDERVEFARALCVGIT